MFKIVGKGVLNILNKGKYIDSIKRLKINNWQVQGFSFLNQNLSFRHFSTNKDEQGGNNKSSDRKDKNKQIKPQMDQKREKETLAKPINPEKKVVDKGVAAEKDEKSEEKPNKKEKIEKGEKGTLQNKDDKPMKTKPSEQKEKTQLKAKPIIPTTQLKEKLSKREREIKEIEEDEKSDEEGAIEAQTEANLDEEVQGEDTTPATYKARREKIFSVRNEKYKIDHKYEKLKPLPKEESKLLEELTTQMLRSEGISSMEAEQIKKEIRNPLKDALGPNLLKIDRLDDAMEKYVPNQAEYELHKNTFEAFDRLTHYQREEKDLTNPAYIKIRSMDRLAKNSEMEVPVPKNTDVRQNVNSKEWRSKQPRMQVNYSYNIEGNKEFHKLFSKLKKDDMDKQEYEEKVLKYIKTNPTDNQVRTSLMPKYLTEGMTVENIPNSNIDITNFKPKISKKSRRKYSHERHDRDISNYEAWRCFDREWTYYSPQDMAFVRVELIPSNLILVKIF
jgi:hypothetical protein